MSVLDPEQVVSAILQKCLDLDAGQIVCGFQDWAPPTDDSLYIVVTDLGPIPISASSEIDGSTEGAMVERQSVVSLHPIQIDVLSFGNDAVLRLWEVQSAFATVAAQGIMEVNGCQVSRHPKPFVNTSGVEGAQNLKRYTGTVNLTALHTKENAVDFYDTFSHTEVIRP